MTGVPQTGPLDTATEANALRFFVQQMLNKLAGPTLVQVISCTNTGGVSPVGMVNVQPLVNQLSGNGQPVPHGTVYNLPYFRIQGGANAVILDPQPGDIGMACFCSRDISSVKASKAQANPGSFRTWDWADGLYLGGFLNGAPTTYVQFSANGSLNVVSPLAINLTAPTVNINASESLNINSPSTDLSGASITVDDATIGGIGFLEHVHGGVQPGSSDTGVPQG
jgi:hypothetical protein